ncbi:DUF927 domain-containing protein [Rhizobium sp. RAF56]|uniref:DUF927 domain-containing protein n=1 Tax=Rhizobium sp. RAF56 TaxID=3233062 RepID=UPI003F98400C
MTKGLQVAIRDEDGTCVPITLQRGELATPHSQGLLKKKLMNAGMLFGPKGEERLMNVLKAADPSKIITVVDRPGFHEVDGTRVYVTLDGRAIGSTALVELDEKVKLPEKTVRRGDLPGWNELPKYVVSLGEGSVHWRMALIGGFLGPMVNYLKLDNCGLNYQGSTSIGKSLALKMVTSCWALPEVRMEGGVNRGLLADANSTGNNIEAIAQRSNGTVCAVDELSYFDPKDVRKLIFEFHTGSGKGRLDRNSEEKAVRSWSSSMFTACESSIEQLAKGVDQKGLWTAGMAARHPDILFDNDDAKQRPAEVIDELKRLLKKNYGHAGPVFAEAIMKLDHDKLREQLAAMVATIGEPGAASAEMRAREVFGLMKLCGYIAVKLDLLPTAIDVEGTVDTAYRLFLDTSAHLLDDFAQAVDNIITNLDAKTDVTIFHVHKTVDRSYHREVEGWSDDDVDYIFCKDFHKFTVSSKAPSAIARELRKRGMLDETRLAADKKLTGTGKRANFTRNIPNHRGPSAYPLLKSFFRPRPMTADLITFFRGKRYDLLRDEKKNRASMGDQGYETAVRELEKKIAEAEAVLEAARRGNSEFPEED